MLLVKITIDISDYFHSVSNDALDSYINRWWNYEENGTNIELQEICFKKKGYLTHNNTINNVIFCKFYVCISLSKAKIKSTKYTSNVSTW